MLMYVVVCCCVCVCVCVGCPCDVINDDNKGSPYSTAESRVPELIASNSTQLNRELRTQVSDTSKSAS